MAGPPLLQATLRPEDLLPEASQGVEISPSVRHLRYHNHPSDPSVQIDRTGVPGSRIPRQARRLELLTWAVEASFICSVCDDLLENPVKIKPCGHEVCEKCFALVDLVCPMHGCGRSVVGKLTSGYNRTKRAIDEMRIRCYHGLSYDVKEGRFRKLSASAAADTLDSYCKVELLFTELEAHAQNCPYMVVECENVHEGCTELILQRDRAIHSAHCPYMAVTCENAREGCREFILRRDRVSHSESCAWRQVVCDVCHARVSHLSLEEHKLTACLDRTPSLCQHARYGCMVEGTRHSLREHEQSCAFGKSEVQALVLGIENQRSHFSVILREEKARANSLKLAIEAQECEVNRLVEQRDMYMRRAVRGGGGV